MDSDEDNKPAPSAQPAAATSRAAPPKDAGSRKRVFTKEIKHIMYGYGDVLNPDDDTVDVLEDMLLMFWGDLCMKSLAVSSTGRVRIGDVTFVLRKDARKLGRVLELIALEKELAKARNTLGADVTVKGAGAKEFTSTTTTAAGSRSQDADDDFNDLSDDPDFIIPPLPSAQAQAQAKKDDDFDDIMLE